MDNLEEIAQLRQECEDYQLDGREILDMFTLEEIAQEFNGAGPDSWPAEARDILTKAMELFKPVVLIHDLEFAHSDGTDEGFAQTVANWCANTRKIRDAEYPVNWWKILFNKSYRMNVEYWTCIMESTNYAIATNAAKDAWIAAYQKRRKNYA